VSAPRPRDRWLFLTPEPEAELPAAVAALRAGLDEPGADASEEAERLRRLVLRGSYADWLDELIARRELLERYVERVGSDALAVHVATVLNEQHMLALTVPGGGARAERERERVGELLRATAGPAAR
jgi:hypothetical protein